MTTDEAKTALAETFLALKELHGTKSTSPGGSKTGATLQVGDASKSIQKNKVVCLECGKGFKMLSGKHLASHGLDAKSYRAKYGLPTRQPLCCKALSAKRSDAGKERGIPYNLRKAIAECGAEVRNNPSD